MDNLKPNILPLCQSSSKTNNYKILVTLCEIPKTCDLIFYGGNFESFYILAIFLYFKQQIIKVLSCGKPY